MKKFHSLIGIGFNSNIIVSFADGKYYACDMKNFFTEKGASFDVQNAPRALYVVPFVRFESDSDDRYFFLKLEFDADNISNALGGFFEILKNNNILCSPSDKNIFSYTIDSKSIPEDMKFTTSKIEHISDALYRLRSEQGLNIYDK
jgi:hypothetical protein